MILNFSQRTDIVSFYTEWMFARFREGNVYVRNPLFPNRVTRYILAPDKVDAVVFRSKDYSPALAGLDAIVSRYRTLFQFTIGGYGRDMEPDPLSEQDALAALCELERIAGKRRIVWRYDPVLFTKKYTVRFHLETFERLAAKICPHVGGCIVGFEEPSLGLHERLPGLSFGKSERRAVLMGLGSIAKKYSLPIRLCGRGEDYSLLGIERRGCVTLDDIACANDCKFRPIKTENSRRACSCVLTRDVGWYNSCPRGCLYCDAARIPSDVSVNRPLHDPASPLLIGRLRGDDIVRDGNQESYLAGNDGQMSIFDL